MDKPTEDNRFAKNFELQKTQIQQAAQKISWRNF